jgi:hypothetical protein
MNQAEDESLTKSIGKVQIERTETKICDEEGLAFFPFANFDRIQHAGQGYILPR